MFAHFRLHVLCHSCLSHPHHQFPAGRSWLVAPVTWTPLETQLRLQAFYFFVFLGGNQLLSAKVAKGSSLRWTHARQISCLLKSNTKQGCEILHTHTHTNVTQDTHTCMQTGLHTYGRIMHLVYSLAVIIQYVPSGNTRVYRCHTGSAHSSGHDRHRGQDKLPFS